MPRRASRLHFRCTVRIVAPTRMRAPGPSSGAGIRLSPPCTHPSAKYRPGEPRLPGGWPIRRPICTTTNSMRASPTTCESNWRPSNAPNKGLRPGPADCRSRAANRPRRASRRRANRRAHCRRASAFRARRLARPARQDAPKLMPAARYLCQRPVAGLGAFLLIYYHAREGPFALRPDAGPPVLHGLAERTVRSRLVSTCVAVAVWRNRDTLRLATSRCRRVDVERTLALRGLLDHHRNQRGDARSLLPGSRPS